MGRKSTKITKIKILKLKTGESIISGVVSKGKNTILQRPMTLLVNPTSRINNGIVETSLFLKNWVDCTDDTSYTVSTDLILTAGNPEREVMSLYNYAVFREDMCNSDMELQETLKEIKEKNPKNDFSGSVDKNTLDDKNLHDVGFNGGFEDEELDEDCRDDEFDGNGAVES